MIYERVCMKKKRNANVSCRWTRANRAGVERGLVRERRRGRPRRGRGREGQPPSRRCLLGRGRGRRRARGRCLLARLVREVLARRSRLAKLAVAPHVHAPRPQPRAHHRRHTRPRLETLQPLPIPAAGVSLSRSYYLKASRTVSRKESTLSLSLSLSRCARIPFPRHPTSSRVARARLDTTGSSPS